MSVFEKTVISGFDNIIQEDDEAQEELVAHERQSAEIPQEDKTSFCKAALMCQCEASAKEQPQCGHYRPSIRRTCCAHYWQTLGGHCDNPEAQREAREGGSERRQSHAEGKT